jgi:exosortase
MKLSRNFQFAAFSFVVLLLFGYSLKEFFSFSELKQILHYRGKDYLLSLPLISAYFFYKKRTSIFSNVGYSVYIGSLIVLAGFALYATGKEWQTQFTQNDYLSVMVLSALTTWIGGFNFLFGFQAFKKAIFPFFFLILMVPIPNMLLEQITVTLQIGSVEVVDFLLKILSVPVFREGIVFSLSTQDFEVVKDCAGIRTFQAFLVFSLIFGHINLKTLIGKIIFTFLVVPITILENGLRIVTLFLLGNYLSMNIFEKYHNSAALPSLIIGVGLLLVALWCLRKIEKPVTTQENA